MSLVDASAFTQHWRTSYHFNTAAGMDVFFDLFAEQQRAMLHPDYTDEEIRREVRNFGVTKNADGTLRLEEKGTVYNEMVSSRPTARWQALRAQSQRVYGKNHPLRYNPGGEPSGIRTMTPEDIRNFHARHHHLANMGTVAAFPKSVPLDDVLARFDSILMKDAPKGRAAPGRLARQAAQPGRRPRARSRIASTRTERAAAQPAGAGLAGQPRARRRRAAACRALLRQPRRRRDDQPLQALRRQQHAARGHRRDASVEPRSRSGAATRSASSSTTCAPPR